MSGLVGQLVNALALIGAIALAAYVFRSVMARRKSLEDAPQSSLSERMREDIDDRAQTEQEAIEAALKADSVAAALAKLGNKRGDA